MKLEFRDLKKEKWTVEAESTDTVSELKAKNAAVRGLGPDAAQKLIYSGKILKDGDKLDKLGYVEGKGYVVCMVSKARPKPAAAAPTSATTPSKPTSASQTPVQAPAGPGDQNPAAPATPAPSARAETPAGSSAQPSSDPASVFAVGPQLESIVANICEMGYSRNRVILAMRRAYNNPDRAVEYLVTDQIPEDVGELEQSAPSATPAAPGGTRSASPESGSGHAVEPEAQSQLDTPDERPRDTTDVNLFDAPPETQPDPDFQSLLGLSDDQVAELRNGLRTAAERDPDSLRYVLRDLGPVLNANPELAAVIRANEDAFLHWLYDVDDADFLATEDEMLGAVEGGLGGDDLVGPPSYQIEVTPEENEAIQRLVELGFDRGMVIQAYFACDKDEQITANFLFEHGDED